MANRFSEHSSMRASHVRAHESVEKRYTWPPLEIISEDVHFKSSIPDIRDFLIAILKRDNHV